MPIIILIVLLSVLRYFEIGPFADMSWWWIAGLFAAAALWFEFIERMLGLDQRKARQDQLEQARRQRVSNTFKK